MRLRTRPENLIRVLCCHWPEAKH